MSDVMEYADMPDPNKAAMHSVMVMEQWGNFLSRLFGGKLGA